MPLSEVAAFLQQEPDKDTVDWGAVAVASDEARSAYLSADHIRPHTVEPSVSYAVNGRSVKILIPSGRHQSRDRERGRVKGFSKSSRMSLQHLVASFDQKATRAVEYAFVTLTYPREWPTPERAKQDLWAWVKRFERAWGPHGLIWKLEPQERGAPHFHLLVHMGGDWDVGEVMAWAAKAWHEIAGAGDSNHLLVHLGEAGGNSRPCVERVKDFDSVGRYAGKYLGKVVDVVDGWPWPGRFWGTRRDELLKITRPRVEVSKRVAVILGRACRRFMEHQECGVYRVCNVRQKSDEATEGGLSGNAGEVKPSRPDRYMPGAPVGQVEYGPVQRVKLGRDDVEKYEDLLHIRPVHVFRRRQSHDGMSRRQRRKWKRDHPGWIGQANIQAREIRSGGGIRLFLSSASIERLIEWADRTVSVGGAAASPSPRAGDAAAPRA